jgi:hypothetical protein
LSRHTVLEGVSHGVVGLRARACYAGYRGQEHEEVEITREVPQEIECSDRLGAEDGVNVGGRDRLEETILGIVSDAPEMGKKIGAAYPQNHGPLDTTLDWRHRSGTLLDCCRDAPFVRYIATRCENSNLLDNHLVHEISRRLTALGTGSREEKEVTRPSINHPPYHLLT